MNVKQAGRLSAIFAGTIVIGLLAWSEISRQKQAEPKEIIEPPAIPTLSDAPASAIGSADGIQSIIDRGAQGVWTNDDPEVGLIRIRWDALDPEPNGLFIVDKPHATFTLDDMRIEVRADSGRLIWPAVGLDQDREPESGTLSGNVRVSIHDADARQDDPPTVELSTGSLNFDTTLGEVKTADDIRIESDTVLFTGTGLTIRYSQTPWKLAFLRVDERSSAIIRESTRDARDGGSKPAGNAAPDDGRKQIDLYRLTLREDVRLRSEFAELNADELLVHAKLVNGRLPDDAIAGFKSTLGRAQPGTSAQRPATAPEPGDPVRFTWEGPLEVRPVRMQPDVLRDEDVHIAISSPVSNRVQLTDLKTGGTLRCVGMEYGATTRSLSIFGLGGIGVQAKMPGTGEALFGRIDLNLTTGNGIIPGPIRVTQGSRGAAPSDRAPVLLTALNGATFRFDTTFGPVGAAGIVDPIEIILNERVEIVDGQHTVSGETVRALFTRRDARTPKLDPQLARIFIEGQAFVNDVATNDRINADAIDLTFDTERRDGALAPVTASARGNASATHGEDTIAANILEAVFATDDSGKSVVSAVSAMQGVLVTTADGIRITADSIETDESTGAINLIGSPIRVADRTDRIEREFIASSARYDRTNKKLTVFGAGTASQRLLNATREEFDSVSASWQESMIYDEPSGRVEMQGDVVLAAENAGIEQHTAKAHLVTVRLSPTSGGPARLLGADLDALDDQTPATIEFKRFVPGNGAQTQNLANLRAGRIEFDALASTIRVPGSGLLLVDDRAESEKTEGDDPFSFGSGGSTLFEWEDLLAFDRGRGLAQIEGRVRVLHRALGASDLIQLECERLAALISEPPAGRPGKPELVRVDATDAVYAKQGPVEIVADIMTYLAAAARIDAKSSEGNLVTIQDEREGRHISARAVSLDVKTGDWRITEATPVTSPE